MVCDQKAGRLRTEKWTVDEDLVAVLTEMLATERGVTANSFHKRVRQAGLRYPRSDVLAWFAAWRAERGAVSAAAA
jgi:hypothetical protein